MLTVMMVLVVVVMMVLVVVVMMVVVVVVIIVLVVVVGGVGIGCNSVGDCVLLPFISYVFNSSFYFKQCCNMAIDKKQQLENVLYRLHPRRTLANCLRKGNAVLHLCQLFLEFFDIFETSFLSNSGCVVRPVS